MEIITKILYEKRKDLTEVQVKILEIINTLSNDKDVQRLIEMHEYCYIHEDDLDYHNISDKMTDWDKEEFVSNEVRYYSVSDILSLVTSTLNNTELDSLYKQLSEYCDINNKLILTLEDEMKDDIVYRLYNELTLSQLEEIKTKYLK